ncbi:hypothetical protein EPICR_220018 [Candidatus Desulfarcum epimagneticum]|uniref:Polymerase nucleotidyl transferase domain-containing protein n=1 Tax=uncultured Desulfobacteraceae bacterium TaxID=218296 RepID=A0A484HL97_9BACT|nr:hypothetical protein EPICR_220018 [uncultured Desulfobacteraceae bacterium]
MADIPDSIRKKLADYVRELSKRNINVKTAIVFGSYASGKYDKWSDIDVALISDDFKGDSLLDIEIDRQSHVEDRQPHFTLDL